MSHQHDEAVFSYSGCLSFDGNGNVTLSVEDFNRLLGRDGYACRLELEAGRLRTALAASEARLDSMTLHYAEVLHDARGKQDVAEADLAASRANCERLAMDRDDALSKYADKMADLTAMTAQRDEATHAFASQAIRASVEHERADSALADVARLEKELTDHIEGTEGVRRAIVRAHETQRQMREALGRAYADCRILAHSYKHDSRPPGEIVKRCLALPVNVMEAVDALAASPCDAKVECEGCRRLRTALEVRETLIAKLREPTMEHRSWVALMDGTPPQTVPMTVYHTPNGQVIVCGDPSDAPDDEDECRHNCDAMGCTTFSHVLWRGSVESFEAMCETAASAMLDDAAIAAPKGGEVGK